MNAILTQFPTPIHPHFAPQSLETHPLHVHQQIFHVMTNARRENAKLSRKNAKLSRENAKLKQRLNKLKPSSKASKAKPKKANSKKAICKSKSGDPIVGFVCANDEFFRLSVYQNSAGKYVKDGGKRINANRFKISKTKPPK